MAAESQYHPTATRMLNCGRTACVALQPLGVSAHAAGKTAAERLYPEI